MSKQQDLSELERQLMCRLFLISAERDRLREKLVVANQRTMNFAEQIETQCITGSTLDDLADAVEVMRGRLTDLGEDVTFTAGQGDALAALISRRTPKTDEVPA